MKKVLFINVLLILTFSTIKSQDRVNRENPTVIKKSDKLIEAIGWKLNDNGQWIDNKNVICDKKCPDYWISHESSNFLWIQMIQISYKGQKYYVLLRESESGVYKYPTIEKDWIPEKRTYYVVMTEKDYLSFLKQYNKKSQKALRLVTISESNFTDRFASLGGESAYTEENILKKIATNIDNISEYSSSSDIGLTIQIYNEKVRFTVGGDYHKPDEAIAKEYYEVPGNEFNKILITD
jgi:hypothetical protein